MQLLLEYLPLAAMLIAYKLGDIYTATATLMVGMIASLAFQWFRTRKFPMIFGASTIMLLLFGTATLVLRSAKFIQWKPSIFLWSLALAFLVSGFVGKQTLVERLFASAMGELKVQARDWFKANLAWVAFCVLAGAANLYVAYNFSEAAWLKIKVFGLSGAMFVFMFSVLLWLHSRGKAPAAQTTDANAASGK
jgi:intracellular septation protein